MLGETSNRPGRVDTAGSSTCYVCCVSTSYQINTKLVCTPYRAPQHLGRTAEFPPAGATGAERW
jgi:hypothetical protein